MEKKYTKEEKLKMLKQVNDLGCATGAKLLHISKNTLWRWRNELNILGEAGLIPGNGSQSRGLKRTGRPKNIDFKSMTKDELIKYIEMMHDAKKYLTKSIKKKFWAIWYLRGKYLIKNLCFVLNISRSGYYKWLKNGMNKFNKWNIDLAKLIKNIFIYFKGIYGYKMITLIIKKLHRIELKFHVVYRYMRAINLKSNMRIKKFNYKLSSGELKYDNILNQNFKTTACNQKMVQILHIS